MAHSPLDGIKQNYSESRVSRMRENQGNFLGGISLRFGIGSSGLGSIARARRMLWKRNQRGLLWVADFFINSWSRLTLSRKKLWRLRKVYSFSKGKGMENSGRPGHLA